MISYQLQPKRIGLKICHFQSCADQCQKLFFLHEYANVITKLWIHDEIKMKYFFMIQEKSFILICNNTVGGYDIHVATFFLEFLAYKMPFEKLFTLGFSYFCCCQGM